MQIKNIKIVAIDDDAGDLEIIRRHLEEISDWNVEFLAFEDQAMGLAEIACQGEEIDCVLLDYLMGMETGIDLIRILREDGNECPVMILSGHGDEAVAVEALQSGASDYLPKSALSPGSLRRAIGNALEKNHLKQMARKFRQNQDRAYRDLKRRNQEIQSFYHTLSHEMKTPLTAAREFLSIVLDGIAGELADQQREYLQIAKESCDQMVAHINDLLDTTRIETGKLHIERKPTDLAKLVSHVKRTIEASAAEKGIELVLEEAPELPDVELDPNRINQVVTNLLNNAIKFTPENGRICVGIRNLEEAGLAEVSVTDTGRGIDADDVERIFDRLFQTQKDDYYIKGGMGLGLNICRELIRLHGGEIRVESEPGKGSTFTFSLPLPQAAGQPAGNQNMGLET